MQVAKPLTNNTTGHVSPLISEEGREKTNWMLQRGIEPSTTGAVFGFGGWNDTLCCVKSAKNEESCADKGGIRR